METASIVLGVIVFVCALIIFVLYGKKSELDLKMSELQKELNATKDLINKPTKQITEDHKKALDEATKKILDLRVQTCLALDGEAQGYTQEECKNNKAVDNVMELMDKSSQVVLKALAAKYIDLNSSSGKLVKAYIDALTTLDPKIDKAFNLAVGDFQNNKVNEDYWVNHVRRECENFLQKNSVNRSIQRDVEISSLIDKMIPIRPELRNYRYEPTQQTIDVYEIYSNTAGDVSRELTRMTNTNNAELLILHDAIRESFSYFFGYMIEMCSQVNATRNTRDAREVLIHHMNGLRKNYQFHKNMLYMNLIMTVQKYGNMVKQPAVINKFDFTKFTKPGIYYNVESNNIIHKPYPTSFNDAAVNTVQTVQATATSHTTTNSSYS